MSDEAKGPWVGKKIAVLYGGDGAEREVSLKTGESLHEGLVSLGYDASLVDVDIEALRSLAQDPPDVVMIALHGAIGENGSIQGFLECLGIPYTGSGVYTSALAMHKATTKKIWADAKLPTPDWRLLSREQVREMLDDEEMNVPIPVVVKPATGGSSVGISLVRKPGKIRDALRRVLRQPGPVLLEGLVDGRELSVALMDGHPMGIVEIVAKDGFYDYDAKYAEGAETDYRIPAPLTSRLQERITKIAEEAVHVMGARGVVRLDVLLDASDEPWLLELNTVPGMTKTSLVPKIAEKTGLSFPRFVEMMLNRACLDIESDNA